MLVYLLQTVRLYVISSNKVRVLICISSQKIKYAYIRKNTLAQKLKMPIGVPLLNALQKLIFTTTYPSGIDSMKRLVAWTALHFHRRFRLPVEWGWNDQQVHWRRMRWHIWRRHFVTSISQQLGSSFLFQGNRDLRLDGFRHEEDSWRSHAVELTE